MVNCCSKYKKKQKNIYQMLFFLCFDNFFYVRLFAICGRISSNVVNLAYQKDYNLVALIDRTINWELLFNELLLFLWDNLEEMQ